MPASKVVGPAPAIPGVRPASAPPDGRPDLPSRSPLRCSGPQRFTGRTTTDLAALLRDLDAIRARGWPIDDKERNLGMRCAGSVIFNGFAKPIAGISLSGPTVRMTPEVPDRLGPLVREAAAEISRLIAGRAP